jgi:hypothetical protein
MKRQAQKLANLLHDRWVAMSLFPPVGVALGLYAGSVAPACPSASATNAKFMRTISSAKS